MHALFCFHTQGLSSTTKSQLRSQSIASVPESRDCVCRRPLLNTCFLRWEPCWQPASARALGRTFSDLTRWLCLHPGPMMDVVVFGGSFPSWILCQENKVILFNSFAFKEEEGLSSVLLIVLWGEDGDTARFHSKFDVHLGFYETTERTSQLCVGSFRFSDLV